MSEYKLSLVAHFDDEIVKNQKILTEDIETNLLQFVLHERASRRHWAATEQELELLRETLKRETAEKDALQTKLDHARQQIGIYMKKAQRCEDEKESLARQIMLVRELLTDKNNATLLNDKDRERLAFLSTDFNTSPHHKDGSPRRPLGTIQEKSASLLSPSDFSFDKTDERDLDTSFLRNGRKWKRSLPSAPPYEGDEIIDTASPIRKHRRTKSGGKRRHRRSRSAAVTLDEQPESPPADRPKRRSSGRHRTLRKSFSTTAAQQEAQQGDSGDENGRGPRPQVSTPPNPWSPGLRHYNSAGKSLNRVHAFVTKTVIRTESCIPCGKRIKFGKAVVKCKDCRATAHPDCRDQVPLPCVPVNITPGNQKSGAGYLADFAPADAPMIPAIVIHCVTEVESRGLNEIGIYRKSGADSEVKDLKQKFLRGKGTPYLAGIDDIHVICSCLKDFFRTLKEPLITTRLWHDFVKGAENNDQEEGLSQMHQAISELPQPNRDTMAFLVLHLQRVAECNECQMPASNLARVFGPTMIGYSSPDPEPTQMVSETRQQQAVMERLIAISADFWVNFVNIGHDDPYTGRESIARDIHAVPHSMLGPVSTPGDDVSHLEKRSWFTPKFGSSRGRQSAKAPYRFFASPMMQ